MKYKIALGLLLFLLIGTMSYVGYAAPTTNVKLIGIGCSDNCSCGWMHPDICPSGVRCCGGATSPRIQISPNMYPHGLWIVGISRFKGSPQCDVYGSCGMATLHFYKDPVWECPPDMNLECIDPEQLNEVLVVTVPVVVRGSQAEQDLLSNPVPLGYIPPAQENMYFYGVGVEPGHGGFSYRYNQVLYCVPDDGLRKMSARLKTDKPQYGDENVHFSLEVRDEKSGEKIQVDSISGRILLPNQTMKTVTTDMWVWNGLELQYEYTYNLKNDAGKYSNPKEGVYSAHVTARKASYEDIDASTTFIVCHNIQFELDLGEKPHVFAVGETVIFKATISDRNGAPVSGNLRYELKTPGGSYEELTWKKKDENVYLAIYHPKEEGIYFIAVWLEDENGICYLGKASASFEVLDSYSGEFSCDLSEVEIASLIDKYSPYMCFYGGVGGDEKYYPTFVEFMLNSSTFWEYGSNEINEYDITQYKAEFISRYNSDYYLDMEPEGNIISSDFIPIQADHRNVYARVACFRHEGDYYIVVQYWFFYIYNDHGNDHEGEWEMILVLLDYKKREPVGAAYSRHFGGEYRPWEFTRVVDNTHPKVYIAEGSHAAYFSNGFFPYQGWFDKTNDNGWKGTPASCIQLRDQPWLDFAGNWGCRTLFGYTSGPHGPKYQGEKWDDPVEWALSNVNEPPDSIHVPYTIYQISCPADMLITNSSGQRLGFSNGEFVQEIPGSYVQDNDEEETYLIKGKDEYTVEIFGTGQGSFDLACVTRFWDRARTLKYSSIPVNELTRAVLALDSDLFLNVDENQDGITDFVVSPVFVELSSPQPIKPLQVDKELAYELILTNQGDPSFFILEVDAPLSWFYSLSADTVFLSKGESTTVSLTISVPPEILPEDYPIRVEATSLGDDDMTAEITLVASSKAELIVESIVVSQDQEEVTLTTLISNRGRINTENVSVQFYNGPPSQHELLGEQDIQVPSGQSVTISLDCVLPDDFYTFYVVVDPENAIHESCESNNVLSIEYLLDRTPPEVELFFDVKSEDLTIRGIDNLDSLVDIAVTEEKVNHRTVQHYILTDDAGNTPELQLEINHAGHQINGRIISMKYNGNAVNLPKNHIKIEYIIEQGNIKKLNQFFALEDEKVHLIYYMNKDETRIITHSTQTQDGILIIILETQKGQFYYRLEEIT